MFVIDGLIEDAKATEIVTALANGEVSFSLSSAGGSVIAAQRIATAFRENGNVTCHVAGECSSAALLILASAKKTIASDGTLFLSHRSSANAQGNADQLKAVAYALELADDVLIGILSWRVSKENVTKLVGENDYTFGVGEAQKLGLIDDVVTALAMAKLLTGQSNQIEPSIKGNGSQASNGGTQANNGAQSTTIIGTRYTTQRPSKREGMAQAIASKATNGTIRAESNPYLGLSLEDVRNEVSSDFPNVISDSMELIGELRFKAMDSMNDPRFEWMKWAGMSITLPDFSSYRLAGLLPFGDIPQLERQAEIRHVHTSDAKLELQLGTNAGIYSLSRDAIRSNQLRRVLNIAEALTDSAMSAAGAACVRVLRGEVAGFDGADWYSAERGNQGSSVPSSSALDQARQSLLEMEHADVPVPSYPMHIVSSGALSGTLRAIIASEYSVPSTGARERQANEARDLVATTNVHAETRIDDATEWYAIAEGAIELVRLESQQSPQIDAREDFATLDTQFRVLFDTVAVGLPIKTFRGNNT